MKRLLLAYARHNLSCVSRAQEHVENNWWISRYSEWIDVLAAVWVEEDERGTSNGDDFTGRERRRPAGYVGYCQSMNYLAAQLLFVLGVRCHKLCSSTRSPMQIIEYFWKSMLDRDDNRRLREADGQSKPGVAEEDWDDTGSFWVLTALVERILPAYYNDLSGVVQDVRLPRLQRALEAPKTGWAAGVVYAPGGRELGYLQLVRCCSVHFGPAGRGLPMPAMLRELGGGNVEQHLGAGRTRDMARELATARLAACATPGGGRPPCGLRKETRAA